MNKQKRIKELERRDRTLEVLLSKSGFHTARQWVEFLLIKHTSQQIVETSYLDLFYPAWIEQIDYLCNQPIDFKEWHKEFKRNLLDELSSME